MPIWQIKILTACAESDKTGRELLGIAGYQKRTGNFKKGIQHLLEKGYIVLTVPDKPNSKFQKYRITLKGRQILEMKEQKK
ncbi:MAG: Fic family protein [bacterium]